MIRHLNKSQLLDIVKCVYNNYPNEFKKSIYMYQPDIYKNIYGGDIQIYKDLNVKALSSELNIPERVISECIAIEEKVQQNFKRGIINGLKRKLEVVITKSRYEINNLKILDLLESLKQTIERKHPYVGGEKVKIVILEDELHFSLTVLLNYIFNYQSKDIIHEIMVKFFRNYRGEKLDSIVFIHNPKKGHITVSYMGYI